MAGTLQITDTNGSPMLLDGAYAGRRDSVADVINNSSAVSPALPFSLSWNSKYVIGLKKNSDITLSFSPDSSEPNGQGVYIPDGYYAEVSSVSGTVYFTSNKHLKVSDDYISAYSNANKINANSGMIVSGGYLVCNSAGSMVIKLYPYPGDGGGNHAFGGSITVTYQTANGTKVTVTIKWT